MKIESGIIIRNFMEADLFDLYRLYSDNKSMEFNKEEMIKNEEEALKLLKEKQRNELCFALTLNDNTFIGELLIIEVRKGIFEFSPIIKSEYMRKGYATKAVNTMISYLSERSGAIGFRAYSSKDNIPFISFLEEIGFNKSRVLGNDIEFEL